MLAMKKPSKNSYQKAITACSEASMFHLEAMAHEHYAIMLNEQGDSDLANNHITSSYWLYKDWGATAKAIQLSDAYTFLKVGASYFTVLSYSFFCI